MRKTPALQTAAQPSLVDILAIAAHRDDVEQTCGGTLLKMTETGFREMGWEIATLEQQTPPAVVSAPCPNTGRGEKSRAASRQSIVTAPPFCRAPRRSAEGVRCESCRPTGRAERGRG